MITRLRSRITAIFVTLLLVVQTLVFVVLLKATERTAEATLAEQLDTGHRVFQQTIIDSQAQLQVAASTLADDASLQRAVVGGDRTAVRYALINFGERIVADAMVLVDGEGALLVHSLADDGAVSSAVWPELARRAVQQSGASAFGLLGDGALYQLVALPLHGVLSSNVVVVGFKIGNTFASSIHATLDQHVSVLRIDADDRANLLASSLPPQYHAALETLALPLHDGNVDRHRRLRLADDDFETRMVPLAVNGRERVYALLQRSFDTAMAPFRQQAIILAAVSLAGVALFALGSVILARRLADPVNRLAAAARRIEEGKYTDAVPGESDGSDVANVANVANDEIGMLVSSFNHMRSAIERREERIAQLAYHDALTGLPNRTLLSQRLDQAIVAAKADPLGLAVLLINLDRFKNVNFSLGHAAGDEVLRVVAERLGTLVRANDTLASLGGDEFVIVMQHCSVEQAPALADRVYAALSAEPFLVQGIPVDLNASIGISGYPRHGNNATMLLRCAELALYESKRTRFGHVVYDPSVEADAQGHLQTLGELRRAVQNDELELHYQPKVSLARPSRIIGAEALLRWRHPTRGMVPPGDFIPFAESTGFVRVLTTWVLRTAVRQLRMWRDAGLGLELAVNISAHDLSRPEFAEAVAAVLREFAVEPAKLTLELTESGFMSNPGLALQTLTALHRIGVQLAIDDYGTGYASLAYLQKMPIQQLKIDRSFVMDMHRRTQDTTIVRSTIELAHGLGLHVVAEGVELPEHEKLLVAMGCDAAQGYGIAKPMSREAFEAWCVTRQSAGTAELPLPRHAVRGLDNPPLAPNAA